MGHFTVKSSVKDMILGTRVKGQALQKLLNQFRCHVGYGLNNHLLHREYAGATWLIRLNMYLAAMWTVSTTTLTICF